MLCACGHAEAAAQLLADRWASLRKRASPDEVRALAELRAQTLVDLQRYKQCVAFLGPVGERPLAAMQHALYVLV